MCGLHKDVMIGGVCTTSDGWQTVLEGGEAVYSLGMHV